MLRRTCFFLALPTDKKAFMELVRDLRYKTEAPITDCTAALKEADGDMEAAAQILKKKGSARAMKKGDRSTEHGFVVSCVSPNPAHGAAILTVCSETDFAARNEHFQKICVQLRNRALAEMEKTEGAFLTQPDEAVKVLSEQCAADIQTAIAVMGENVRVRSVTPLRVAPHVSERICIGSYTHGSIGAKEVGRIVGLVALSRLGEENVAVEVTTSVARHFVSNAGAEGNYAHQKFFGSEDQTVGQWLKQHQLKFSSSVVLEFGKEPVIHTAPEIPAGKK